MYNSKISVIIPIYKVEKYLKKCIESVQKQTYKNIEIILIDDGSPDECPRICDFYASNDSRIKVIHKINGGLSDARNAGIQIATGEYIGFVDSDDWIDESMFEILMLYIIKNNADISEIGVKYQYNDHIEYNNNTKIEVLTHDESMSAFLEQTKNIKGCVWAKLYKSNIVKNLKFPIGRLHEDAFFTYKAIYNSRRYVIGTECLYNYRQDRDGSIMSTIIHENDSKSKNDIIDAFEERNQFFIDHNEIKFAEQSKAYYYRTLVTFLRNSSKSSSEQTRLRIANKINLQHIEILKNRSLTISWKIKYIFLRIINHKIFEE